MTNQHNDIAAKVCRAATKPQGGRVMSAHTFIFLAIGAAVFAAVYFGVQP